jgi:hypothetical protein
MPSLRSADRVRGHGSSLAATTASQICT